MTLASQLYYLDRYCDEVMPQKLEKATLDGWASWLSKGGEQRGKDDCWTFDPPADGAEFSGSRLTFDDDILVERLADDEKNGPVLKFSRDEVGIYDFVAIRFGAGMGWGPEDILDPGDVAGNLANDVCPLLEPGDDALLAVATNENLVFVYRANPPRLEIAGSVQ